MSIDTLPSPTTTEFQAEQAETLLDELDAQLREIRSSVDAVDKLPDPSYENQRSVNTTNALRLAVGNDEALVSLLTVTTSADQTNTILDRIANGQQSRDIVVAKIYQDLADKGYATEGGAKNPYSMLHDQLHGIATIYADSLERATSDGAEEQQAAFDSAVCGMIDGEISQLAHRFALNHPAAR